MNEVLTIRPTKFPVVLISDVHLIIHNVDKIKAKYPESPILCLGDITDLFSYKGPDNSNAIQHFAKNNIPLIMGNHEEHISGQNEHVRIIGKIKGAVTGYDITKAEREYISKLPGSIKILLPDDTHYLLYHSRPLDRWNYTLVDMTPEDFKRIYQPLLNTRGIAIGHNHQQFSKNFGGPTTLYAVGSLKLGEYALLNETTITLHKL